MNEVDHFSIQLEKPDEVCIYSAGENILGHVLIRVLKRFKINGVRLVADCECRTKWTDGSGKNKRTYKGKERYFDARVSFLERAPNQDLFLETGDYSFPFTIQLPTDVPTSFEHFNGQIRYSIKATIDVPWTIDMHTSRVFSVINHLDLNKMPELQRPQEVIESKTLCCGPCKSDPIIGELNINKTGFVPGETIVCHASVDNRSRRSLGPMRAILVQKITVKTSQGARSSPLREELAVETFEDKIEPHSHEDWSHIRMQIPPVCSSNCHLPPRIIQIEYAVELVINISGMHLPKELSIPIVIGTIPMHGQFEQGVASAPVFYFQTFSNDQNEE